MIRALFALVILNAPARAGIPLPVEHVYKINVFGCPIEPHNHVLTGFRIAGHPGIYTALHGVAGYETINAVSDAGHAVTGLSVVAVDVRHDVAVLYRAHSGLEAAPGAGLAPLTGEAELTEGLYIAGYPLNTMNLNATGATLHAPWIQEFDKFGDNLGPFLKKRGSPDRYSRALNIDGHVLPCDSGAPILNEAGQVVGVAIGGLQGGYASHSYAVPVWRLDPVSITPELGQVVAELGRAPIGEILHCSSGESMSDIAAARYLGRSGTYWIWLRSGFVFPPSSQGGAGPAFCLEIGNPWGSHWKRNFAVLLEYTALEYHQDYSYELLGGVPVRTVEYDEEASLSQIGIRYYLDQRGWIWPQASILGGFSRQGDSEYPTSGGSGAALGLETGIQFNSARMDGGFLGGIVGRLQVGLALRYSLTHQELPDAVTFNPFGDADVESQDGWRWLRQPRIEIGIQLLGR